MAMPPLEMADSRHLDPVALELDKGDPGPSREHNPIIKGSGAGTWHDFDQDPVPDLQLTEIPNLRVKDDSIPPLENPSVLPLVDKSSITYTVFTLVIMVCILQAILWVEWVKMAEQSMETPLDQSLEGLLWLMAEIALKVTKWARFGVQYTVGASNIQLVEGLANYSSFPAGTGTTNCDGYIVSGIACSGYTSNIVYNSTNMCNTAKYILGLAENLPQVPFLGIGFEDGTIVASSYSGTEQIVKVRDAQNVLGQGTGYNGYGIDSSTGCWDLTDQRSTSSSYDPRNRSWYSQTKANNASCWGNGTYSDFDTQSLIISATQPVYGADNTTGEVDGSIFIGVALADCELDSISSQLAKLNPGKNGQAYITEYVNDQNYVVGTSTGNVLVDNERTTPPASNSSVIRNSYDWLLDRYSVDGSTGGLTFSNTKVKYAGDVFHDASPMSGMGKFIDSTGYLLWTTLVGIPATDYEQFILDCVYSTAGLTVLTISLLASLVYIPLKFNQDNGIIDNRVSNQLETKIMKRIIGCTAIGAALWVLWLVYTKTQTDSAVEDSLGYFQRALATNLTWRWEEYPLGNNASFVDYVRGFLPLNDTGAVDGDTGKLIDAHTANRAAATGTMAAVYFGFPNGDIAGMFYFCKIYPSSCSDPWYLASMVRSETETDRKYAEYNVTRDASGTSYVRDTSANIGTYSVYDCTSRPWYTKAVAAERSPAGSNFGKPAVSAVYTFGTALLVSIVQAYYENSTATTPIAVAAVDIDYSYLSGLMYYSVPSSGSESTIQQDLGELLAASNLVVQEATSDGSTARLNVSNSALTRVREYAVSVYEEEYSYTASQNQSNLHGNFVQATAAASNYDTLYTFLADKLNTWTYIQAFERSVYYQSLDDGTERNFVIIVFAFTAILYLSASMVEYSITRIVKNQHKLLEAHNCEVISEEEQLQLVKEARAKEFAMELFGSVGGTFAEPETSSHHGDPTLTSKYRFGEILSEVRALEISREHGLLPSDATGLVLKDLHGANFECRMVVSRYLEQSIQRMINSWNITDPVELKAKLFEKALLFARLIDVGRPALPALTVLSKFGEHSWQWRMYRFVNCSPVRIFLYLQMVLFIMCALLTDRTAKMTMSIACLVPYTADTVAMVYFDLHGDWPGLTRGTKYAIVMNILLWSTELLVSAGGYENDRGVVLLEDLFRPWMLLVKSTKLTDALALLAKCLMEARNIFYYLFTVVAISAIVVNLTFWEDFNPDYGETVNTFLDSFVYLFIFLTSGENWDVLVYQGYRQSTYSAVLWVFLSLFGIFALMSMVIATFESTYSDNRGQLDITRIANESIANHIVFQCLGWNYPLHASEDEEDDATVVFYKQLPNSVLEEFLDGYMRNDSDDFTIAERINPLLLFPGHTAGKDYSNEAQRNHRESIASALKIMTVLQDVDDNLSVELDEFDDALVSARCAMKLRSDVLLASEAMWLRGHLLVKKTLRGLETCPDWERETKERLGNILRTQESRFELVKDVHKATVHCVKDLVGITPRLSLDRLDSVMVIAMLFHGFWLSLWGSTDQGMIKVIGVCFAGVYVGEVGLRVWVFKRPSQFFNDRRGSNYRFQNAFMLFLAILGTTAQVLYYILDDKHGPLLQGLAAMQLWRILAVASNFRQITHSFMLGMKPVQLFLALLVLVMFTFAVLAHYFFHDVDDGDGTLSFRTLYDSLLAMFQVFIGEGWHGVMETAVDKTNKALIWFFAAYVLLVGVLFSNLFVGVLLSMFQMGQELASCQGGRVELEMRFFCPDYEQDQFEKLLLDLGHMAELMHFPARLFLPSVVARFKSQIDEFGGDVFMWAASMICKRFKQFLARRKRARILELRSQLPMNIKPKKVRLALSQAVTQVVGEREDPTSDEQMEKIVETTGTILALDRSTIAAMLVEFGTRRAGYMRLFMYRLLSPAEKKRYCGIPNPAKVQTGWYHMLETFYSLLVHTLKSELRQRGDFSNLTEEQKQAGWTKFEEEEGNDQDPLPSPRKTGKRPGMRRST
eukprot:TRINITY_DN10977_c0_g1_i8.p1 TRINITY_DN10977_c0_g1~~TRINITY_DN10977_c0_g1_i8.p1  ORF type:complete len:2009 (+),score=485.24 TRINITY_DN10977_c0_g1_i8:238-6264(+)